jgi:ABC-type transport system involved in multi-copper enzyme maturation permease subunit
MSGATAPAGPARIGATGPDRLWWVVRSEWTKLWSLRSTPWTLLATIVLTVGFSVLISWAVSTDPSDRPAGPLDVVGSALAGLVFGQLAIAVLGVLVITGEYASGSIRTTLAAVPGRLRLLTAKAVVVTVVGLVTGVLASFPSFFLGMTFFDAHGDGVGIGEPHVLRAVVGGALLLATCGLFGLAVGVLLRHTAPAITVSIALLLVVPLVLIAVPAEAADAVNTYLLSSAGDDITSVVRQPDSLEPWQGFGVFVAEVALLLAAGAVLMRRRDA